MALEYASCDMLHVDVGLQYSQNGMADRWVGWVIGLIDSWNNKYADSWRANNGEVRMGQGSMGCAYVL